MRSSGPAVTADGAPPFPPASGGRVGPRTAIALAGLLAAILVVAPSTARRIAR